jgi:hypothetical protein
LAGGPAGSPRIDVVFCLWQCDKDNHGWREGPPLTVLWQSVDLLAGPSPSGKVNLERKKNTAFRRRTRTPHFRHWPVYIHTSEILRLGARRVLPSGRLTHQTIQYRRSCLIDFRIRTGTPEDTAVSPIFSILGLAGSVDDSSAIARHALKVFDGIPYQRIARTPKDQNGPLPHTIAAWPSFVSIPIVVEA